MKPVNEGHPEVDARLRTALAAAYPTLESSDALRRRVAELAAGAPAVRSRSPRFPARVRWGLGLAAAVVGAGVLTVWPAVVAAGVLHRMEAKLNDVRSAYLGQWSILPDGTRHKNGEIWYQDGRWRLERDQPRQVQHFVDGKLWSYYPERNEVTVERRAGPFTYNPSGLGFKALVRDYARWGWDRKIRVERATPVNGRPALLVTIEQPSSPERMLLLVDQASDLPLRMEAQRRSGTGWITGVVGEFRFNERLPESMFVPPTPKEARLRDLDAARDQWRKRLEGGIERQAVNNRTIVLRDFQVNAQGDVFVLYTAGKLPGDVFYDSTMRLRDERGTTYEYSPRSFQPCVTGKRPEEQAGIFPGGEILQSTVFIPAEPLGDSKPHRFTLEIGVPSENIHGEATGRVAINPTEWAKFTVDVRKPIKDSLPEYMPYMTVPMNIQSLNEARELVQAGRK